MKAHLKFRLILLTMILASPLLLAFMLLQESFGTLEAVLVWIATGGGATILGGYVMAYLLENWPAWHTLPRWVKVLFPLAVSGLLGFLAQGAIALDALAQIPEGIKITVLALVNWIFSQIAYGRLKDSSYGKSAREAAEAG